MSKKISKKGSLSTWIFVFICVAAIQFVLLFACVMPLRARAGKMGEQMGTSVGRVEGWVGGFLKGVTTGTRKGHEDGKNAGLSAEDTEAEVIDVAAEVKNAGKLEVLVTTLTIDNLNEVSDKYAALYLLKGEAVFTVDLDQADVDASSESRVFVQLPDLTSEIFVDDSQTEKLAEYQKAYFNGSTEDGMNAYFNSQGMIREKMQESLDGNADLKKRARQAAMNQVKLLAEGVCGGEKEVVVIFKSGGE